MKKNIYLTVLAVITVFCVIFGLLNHTGLLRHHDNSGSESEMLQTIPDGKEKGPDRPASGKTGQTVKEIRAEMELGSLILDTGESFSAEFRGDEDYRPEVLLEKGVLTIRQAKQERTFLDLIKNFNPKAELHVTLPVGTVLETADVYLHLGEADLKGLIVENGFVRNSMGTINLTSCRLGKVNLEADMGDVNARNIVFEDLFIEEDMGKVTVAAAEEQADTDISLNTDLGKIIVNDSEQGNRYSSEGKSASLTVQNDLGDIILDI